MSTEEGIPQEGRECVSVDKVRPRTYGSQGREVTSNTRIDQSITQKGNEAPMLTPTWVKDINLGSYITVVHLCA